MISRRRSPRRRAHGRRAPQPGAAAVPRPGHLPDQGPAARQDHPPADRPRARPPPPPSPCASAGATARSATHPAARSASTHTAADLPWWLGMFDTTDDIAVDLEVAMPRQGHRDRRQHVLVDHRRDRRHGQCVGSADPSKRADRERCCASLTGIDLSSAVALAMRVLRGTTILTYAATRTPRSGRYHLTIAADMFDTRRETSPPRVAATFPSAGSIRPTSTSPSDRNCDANPPLTDSGRLNSGGKPNDQR